jgi:hypothetical protein
LNQNIILLVVGTITNKGGPTIVKGWHFSLRFKDGRIVDGESMLPPTG